MSRILLPRLARTAALALGAALALMPVSASADEAINCDTAVATVDLNACEDKALDQADVAMNAVYKKVLGFIAKSGTEKPYDAKSWEDALRKSQRAWVAFRDADCKDLIPMSWTGGTGTTGAVLGCMLEKTKARTKELSELYELE
jgi:uncharacterized protein YecT (DUF1311 family)